MDEQYNSTHSGAQIDEAISKVLRDAPIFGGVVQTLTDAQKAQARENIGAVTVAEVLEALPTWEGGSY